MDNNYVYALIDPNTDEIFYVGKGTGYRDSSHLKPSMWNNPKDTVNPFLYYKIRSLMESDTPPGITRLLENVSEKEAYDFEHKLITDMGRKYVDGGQLLNISDFKGGSFSGKSKPWSEKRRSEYRIACKKNRIYDPDYDVLFEEYVIQNKTRQEIATTYNISESLLKKRLQQLGIVKPKEKCYPEKNSFVCIRCNKNFLTSKSITKRKYCSKKCYRNIDEIS